MVLLSKIATNDGHGENSSFFDGWKAYDSDPYHPTKNSHGVIQMGLAENQLCFDLIQEWVENNPKASICTPQGSNGFNDIAIYQDYHGLPEFRNSVARFMEKVRGNKVKFNPDRIVMSGGATGAHETLAFCLADPGEAFLVPTPYYPGYDRDLRWRTGIQLFPVVCESSNEFKITRETLEDAYEKAQEANIKVKGLILNNPSNPLGTVLDKTTLRDAMSFICEKNIHLICDEIYSATVFDEPGFISIAEIAEESSVSKHRDLIHIVYSLSKDLGFPGFRVGIIYSYNDAVVNCARKMSSFGLVSTQTQHLIASMLSDDIFVEKFLDESAKRLTERHRVFTRGLAKVGIKSLGGNAGLFCWMDLKRLLKEPTFEAEMELWHLIIDEVKLNVSPGASFRCSEPGWFRVCFANMDDETMRIALQRIHKFVIQKTGLDQPMTRKQYKRSELEISLSFRRLDEFIMTPRMLSSPHSHMTSPLVRART
ncbi:1-aminocyclopropane-1-carboxylate synthase-like [Olea europaea var. sylvestris]|uniref:1-aminocyclopropane-1-carboxylate synthase-like n=1 Tax=Olea europaea var. sylvestris TaxID=158386 RepID=UPI000C1D8623|nr:1-aminocyclopropane-1-carboxylate synthase-like [Olea europaea var. sylvestris]